MSLIKKMLEKYSVEHFFYAQYYVHKTQGKYALMLKKDGMFYDLDNNALIEQRRINFSQPLNKYAKIEQGKITCNVARKLAREHYEEFFKEWENLNQKCEIIKDENHSFYSVI